LDLKGIDLYFLVRDQKTRWKGNEDLLVAFFSVIEEAEVDGIVAFSL